MQSLTTHGGIPPHPPLSPVPLAVAAVVLLAVALTRRAVRDILTRHGWHVLLWRFTTGAHMTRGGVHSCLPGQECRAGRWSHMRRHQRAGVRLAVAVFIAACGYGAAVDLAALVYALAAGSLAAGAGTVLWAWRTTAARRHDRVIVAPLAASLGRVVGVPDTEARNMVQLRAGAMRRARGQLGHVALPNWYAANPDQRKAVDHLISSHLPRDVETEWRTAGAPKRVLISAAPAPPDTVPFDSVRGIIEGLNPGQVLLGLDRRSEPYIGDFTGGDDPHWGFSVGSGRGKSTQLCSIGAQILHQRPSDAEIAACESVGQWPGPAMLGVDPKMSSFDPLAGVPGVELANDPRDIEGMWAAINRYKARMEARIQAKKEDPTLEFPPYLLFMDELNQFAAMTAAHWKNELGEKGTPAIWMSIAAVFWMGRFVHCHGVAVGQRLDEKATGGIGLRDSLGLRGLAGFRPNQWKMLVGTTPVPKSQKPRGRWIYSDGQDETWVQNVLVTPAEARAWAVEGSRHGGPVVPGTVMSDVPLPGSAGPERTDTHTVWVTGLAGAASYLGISRDAFEKARQRNPVPGEMRRGNQPAWAAGDLDNWAASRPRAGAGKDAV